MKARLLSTLLPLLGLSPSPGAAEIPPGNFWPNPTFEEGTDLEQPTGTPMSWSRGGSNAAICEVTAATAVSATHSLVVNDQDPAGYGEWYGDQPLAAFAVAGDLVDVRWSEKFDVSGGGEMRVTALWLRGDGSVVNAEHFVAKNQSEGWTGDLAASPWVARRQAMVVPAEAVTLRLALVSGGSLETVGWLAIDDLSVELRRPPEVLAGNFWPNPGFESGIGLEAPATGQPTGWNRGGNEAGICEVSTAAARSPTHALALNDTSATGYGEWYADAALPGTVQAGDALDLQWWEMHALAPGAAARVTAIFFNAGNGVINDRSFVVAGQSAGWAGSPAASPFVKRNETLVVPAGAVTLRLALVSGGGADGTGVMLIDDLSVAAPARSEILAGNLWTNPTFETGADLDLPTGTPTPWNRGGNDPSVCLVTTASSISPTHALALDDTTTTGYGEWYADLPLPATVRTGDALDLQYFQKFALTGAGSAFRVTALFLGQTGVVGEYNFVVTGQSAGWAGTLAESPWIKRREVLTVPAGTATLRLALVSAGPVEGVGVMALEDVSVARRVYPDSVLSNGQLMNPRFEEGVQLDNPALAVVSGGWQRGGSDGSIAVLAVDAFVSSSHALALQDSRADAYGEWYNFMPLAGLAEPGDVIDVTWHALYDLTGPMRFSVLFFDAENPTGPQQHFIVNGQSPGWTGVPSTSPFVMGGKALVVPDGATRLFLTLASGGGLDSQGRMWLDDVSVRKSSPASDQDGDGQGDTSELLAGTNPFDPATSLRILNLAHTGTVLDVTWTSLVGVNYVVEKSTTLGPADWEPVEGTATTASEETSSVSTTEAQGGPGFYRVRRTD